MKPIGRFAPSPSGRMHLGNVFSALLAYLSIRSRGGKLLLRIEDLDPDRCKPQYAEDIKRDLDWLGLYWDEEQPPQSGRTEAYAACFEELKKRGLVYPCYCSRASLHAASAPHASDGRIVYPGTCRGLQKPPNDKKPAWRLIVPDRTIALTDGLQGDYAENLARDCGDFILRRADGVYAYQLAATCDDAAGGVTEVTRGRDILPSTPGQIYLQELFSWSRPSYYHVPLLIDESGRRLSKRDGDLDLAALRERFTAPELLGRLAWAAGILSEYAPASAEKLTALFDWSKVRREDIIIRRYFV
ncbi:MAG: tRNA glutamyl-Q(34) synthetase GluQRS [Oscillospiraceae bacterium]|nr:tRNA glutamyl-Q(34) synthetase GluQRS [Oscillospiraceae bacterium]